MKVRVLDLVLDRALLQPFLPIPSMPCVKEAMPYDRVPCT